MAITGIDAITYSTESWDEARKFFSDWGLKALGDSDEMQQWETLTGARVEVRRPDDVSLPPPMEAGPTLREVTWGVESAADLDRLASLLGSAPGFADQRSGGGSLRARDRKSVV